MTRLNKLIAQLEGGRTAFSGTLRTGDIHGAIRLGESDLDFVIVDLEHDGFDFPAFGNTMQWLISRRQIARGRADGPCPTPIVRVPHHAGERTHWIMSQALDYGAFGLIVPYVETADDVRSVVGAIRYPQGPAGDGPQGHRGVWPRLAMRYWGCETFDEYVEKADLWPLNPRGEIFLIAMIASPRGVANIEEIAQVPGLGGVLYGPKHAWVSLGRRGPIDLDDPDLVRVRTRLVSACAGAGVTIGTSATGDSPTAGQSIDAAYLRRRIDEGFRFFLTPREAIPVEFQPTITS